jgi:hypothetical protein
MALFEGTSWSEIRNDLFVSSPSGPRFSANATRPKDNLPAEIEVANLKADGMVELLRRSPATPFTILLGSTTMQDLIVELGSPETTHSPHQIETDKVQRDQPRPRRQSNMSNGRAHSGSQPSSYSSTGTDTFDADFDSGEADDDASDRLGRKIFWCFFSHGMDILIGPPSEARAPSNNDAASDDLVVLKVVIHGNVPGSYAFNRHRRLRWNLNFPDIPYLQQDSLNSESNFEHDLRPALMHVYKDVLPESDMGESSLTRIVSLTRLKHWRVLLFNRCAKRLPVTETSANPFTGRGKVINRTWGGSGGGGMSDSSFFLPDAEKELVEGGGSEQWLGNTKLYSFPGLDFEVLDNGAVAALTVS